MAWNPSPEVAEARAIARKWKRPQVIILAIGSDGTVQIVTYGETRQLCDDTKTLGEVAYKAIYDHLDKLQNQQELL